MQGDGLLVGLNWSGPQATGYDLPPMAVAERLQALLSALDVDPAQ